MKKQQEKVAAFVVCICNTDYDASLELHKIYRSIPDASLANSEDVRIVDESGEDYIYPASYFSPINPSAAIVISLLRAS